MNGFTNFDEIEDNIVDDDFEEVVEHTETDEFNEFMAMMGGDVSPEPKEVDPTSVPEGFEDEDEEEAEEAEDTEEADNDEEEDDDSDSEEDEDGDEEEDDEEEEDGEPDSAEVDLDTVITLPNGEELTIEELQNGYREGTELDAEKTAFLEEKAAFEESTKNLADQLELAQLEADRILDDFKDFDWAALASEDPKEFANTKLFVERYAARSKEIRAARDQMQQTKAEQEQNELAVKAKEAVAILERDIPEWSKDLYGKVLAHAMELGMPEEQALKLTDVGTIKALVNSLNSSETKRAVKAKITKKSKTPTKVMKSGTKKASAKKAKPANYTNEQEEFDFFSRILKD